MKNENFKCWGSWLWLRQPLGETSSCRTPKFSDRQACSYQPIHNTKSPRKRSQTLTSTDASLPTKMWSASTIYFTCKCLFCFYLLIEHCHKILEPLLEPQEVGEHVLVTTDTSLPHSKYGLGFLSPCLPLPKFSLTCTFLLYIY